MAVLLEALLVVAGMVASVVLMAARRSREETVMAVQEVVVAEAAAAMPEAAAKVQGAEAALWGGMVLWSPRCLLQRVPRIEVQHQPESPILPPQQCRFAL